MKLKVIAGYPGTPERMLAVERGELDGFLRHHPVNLSFPACRSGRPREDQTYCPSQHAQGRALSPTFPTSWTKRRRLRCGRRSSSCSLRWRSDARLQHPPDTPKDRLEVLRRGTWLTMKDPEFLEDAKKLSIDIEPMDADETTRTANRIFETPADAGRQD